jgi:predicted nuclease with TOPRIM domain
MNDNAWPSDMPENWVNKEIQLRLFPMTEYEILLARVNELETELKTKLEKQRKCQFGKIGKLEKRLTDLEERYEHIERGICQSQAALHECEIFEMVGQ